VPKAESPTKVVDETTHVRCSTGEGIIREEVWQDSKGNVVKYNLAFVNQSLCAKDNGRVLGYDNNHQGHHRHYMANVTLIEFTSYEELLSRFLNEVSELKRK
jgi:hypothetical protein